VPWYPDAAGDLTAKGDSVDEARCLQAWESALPTVTTTTSPPASSGSLT
jgi:hypothetical protein